MIIASHDCVIIFNVVGSVLCAGDRSVGKYRTIGATGLRTVVCSSFFARPFRRKQATVAGFDIKNSRGELLAGFDLGPEVGGVAADKLSQSSGESDEFHCKTGACYRCHISGAVFRRSCQAGPTMEMHLGAL